MENEEQMVVLDSQVKTNLINLSFDEAMDLLVCIDTTINHDVIGSVYRQTLRDLRARIVSTFTKPSQTASWGTCDEH